MVTEPANEMAATEAELQVCRARVGGELLALKAHLLCELHPHQREAGCGWQEKGKAEALETAPHIQEGAGTRPQELFWEDLEGACQLQEKRLVETERSSRQPTLEEQAATVLRRWSQLLLGPDERDSPASELDAQEPRICQPQTKPRGVQAELERTCSHEPRHLEQGMETRSWRQAEGTGAPLTMAEAEMAALRRKYGLALLEAVEQREALHSLWETHNILQQRVAEQEVLICRLEESHTPLEGLQRVRRCEDTLQQLQEDPAASRASQEAAESSSQSHERALRVLQRGERLLPHGRRLLQSKQSRKQAERRAVDLETAQAELLSGIHAERRQLAQDKAALQETLEASGQELTGKEAEGGSLGGQLQHLPDKLRLLRGNCTEQEQLDLAHLLRHEKETPLRQNPSKTALLEQLHGELRCGQQAHLAEMEEMHQRLQRLQQELDVCKGRSQDNLSRLQARECTMEKQSLDLDLLLQQCQTLKDQLCYYEEVTQKQELELCQQHEQGHCLQEKLLQAESSLDLYRKKFQASLGRAGELESQLQRLEAEVTSQAQLRDDTIFQLHSEQLRQQEALESRGRQVSKAEDAIEQLTRELRDAQEELAQGRQREETLRELHRQLAASHAKLLGQEEALAALHRDFASYKATHGCSNRSYEGQLASAEGLRQKLLQVEGESLEHRRRAEEYQSLVQDLELELVRVAEQKSSALQDMAQLERNMQHLCQEAAAEKEKQQLEVAEREQRLQQLEAALRKSHKLCAQKEQALQKRDEVLRKSRAEMVHARSALQEKGQEVDQQRALAHQLEASLQEVQRQLERSQAEGASLRTEAQALQRGLHKSQEQHQRVAQELAQQEEQRRLAQEQLSERVAEARRHTQAGQRLEAECRLLRDRLASAEAELEQKRARLDALADELSQSRQQRQAALQEAQQQRQAASQLELKLASSREGLTSLQQQVQGQQSVLEELQADLSWQKDREEELQQELHRAKERESLAAAEHQDLQREHQSAKLKLQQEEWKGQRLQSQLAEQEAERQALREQLEQARGNLEQSQLQLQQQTADALRQEAALAQLQTELHALHERERQTQRSLAAAKSLAQELKLQAASCQASQREAAEQLEQRVREAACLQAEVQLGQRRVAHLQEELARGQEQTAQLRSQLKALQKAQEEQACTSEERLAELGGQVRRWQAAHQAAEQALARKDEELVVAKVEAASLEEKHHSTAEEREELQAEVNLLRQKFVGCSRQVGSLQTSLEAAQSDSHRLHHESELVVANVSQWVKEQKQVNEKLGHKIRHQIKQIAQLTGERDHLQELMERLQQENKHLKHKVDERHIECERLKALHSSKWDPGAALHLQPWQLLPREDSHCSAWSRSKALAAKGNLS